MERLMIGHFTFNDKGDWTWADSPALTIHGQYTMMYGSCGFVSFELIDSDMIAFRSKLKVHKRTTNVGKNDEL
jgi:hypothetical protein